ncbi:hypothetical protein N9W89_09650 [Hellea sp.]|nr:hypothetical protein [Hellea sp.]
MLWYAVILGIAVIGLISLIMSYDEMKRSHLILAALSILPAIGVFIHMGTSRESVGEVVKTALPPNVIDNLNLYIIGGIVLIIGLLYAEGTITWIWRRVHPKSAPTDELGIGQQGRGNFARKGQSMSSSLMGTSTSMFAVPGLDVKTTALIRLSLYALKKINQKTVIGIESHLRLGDGRRYRAYHSIVGEMQTSRSGLADIVHPYWRAINGNHAAARRMFTDLCQIIRNANQTDRGTINRVAEIGQALGLSPQDMGIAIKNLRG